MQILINKFDNRESLIDYVKKHTTIEYLTIEYYKDASLLVELLKEFKKSIYELSR